MGKAGNNVIVITITHHIKFNPEHAQTYLFKDNLRPGHKLMYIFAVWQVRKAAKYVNKIITLSIQKHVNSKITYRLSRMHQFTV